ncbi:MAG: hypothetical protein ACTS3F_06340 [Phycisphaerales bacterium]
MNDHPSTLRSESHDAEWFLHLYKVFDLIYRRWIFGPDSSQPTNIEMLWRNIALQGSVHSSPPGNYTDEEAELYCQSYEAIGLPDIADMLRPVMPHRPYSLPDGTLHDPTEEENDAMTAVIERIARREWEVRRARYRYLWSIKDELCAYDERVKDTFRAHPVQVPLEE